MDVKKIRDRRHFIRTCLDDPRLEQHIRAADPETAKIVREFFAEFRKDELGE